MTQVLKIFGVPGAGKTHELLRLFEEELKTTPVEKIAFCTFTRSAKKVVLERCGKSQEEARYLRTIHSMCYRQLKLQNSQLVGKKDLKYFGKVIGVPIVGLTHDPWAEEEVAEGVEGQLASKADVLLNLNHLGRHRQTGLKEAFREVGLVDLDYEYAKWFTQQYRAWKSRECLLDYTDLLTQYLEVGEPLPVDVMFIDESQDMSKLQWQVVHKMGANARRWYMAGDDDQCSLQGSKILTLNGYIPVEKLDPKKHRLVPYSLSHGCLVNKKRQGFPFSIRRKKYSGPIVEVEAEGRKTSTTMDHIWLIKWNKTKETRHTYVVYMMKKGTKFRIGQCQFFGSTGFSHLGIRARLENAEALWVLSTYSSRKEAFIEEQVTAAKFGIPTVTFLPAWGGKAENKFRDQTGLNSIFDKLGNLTEKATKCLKAFGRDLQFPFWAPEFVNKYGVNMHRVRSFNLISGLMKVPIEVYEKGVKRNTRWVPITVKRKQAHRWVYGLDVPEEHTYVADGIITHNCIFSWAGASSEAFLEEPCTDQKFLEQSYRLPRRVLQQALEISAKIQRRQAKRIIPRNAEGNCREVEYLSSNLFHHGGSSFVLFRNHHRGHYLASQLEELAIPFKGSHAILESSSTQSLLHAWKKVLHDPKDQLTPTEAKALVDATDPKRLRLEARDVVRNNCTVGQLFDRVPGGQEWPTVLTQLPKIGYVTQCLREHGWERTMNPPVTLLSIHQAKGQQADRVVLDPVLARKTFDSLYRDPDAEHRVFYVAATRAKWDLLWLTPEDALCYQR